MNTIISRTIAADKAAALEVIKFEMMLEQQDRLDELMYSTENIYCLEDRYIIREDIARRYYY